MHVSSAFAPVGERSASSLSILIPVLRLPCPPPFVMAAWRPRNDGSSCVCFCAGWEFSRVPSLLFVFARRSMCLSFFFCEARSWLFLNAWLPILISYLCCVRERVGVLNTGVLSFVARWEKGSTHFKCGMNTTSVPPVDTLVYFVSRICTLGYC